MGFEFVDGEVEIKKASGGFSKGMRGSKYDAILKRVARNGRATVAVAGDEEYAALRQGIGSRKSALVRHLEAGTAAEWCAPFSEGHLYIRQGTAEGGQSVLYVEHRGGSSVAEDTDGNEGDGDEGDGDELGDLF